jgi:multidrug resistance efflux pump
MSEVRRLREALATAEQDLENAKVENKKAKRKVAKAESAEAESVAARDQVQAEFDRLTAELQKG